MYIILRVRVQLAIRINYHHVNVISFFTLAAIIYKNTPRRWRARGSRRKVVTKPRFGFQSRNLTDLMKKRSLMQHAIFLSLHTFNRAYTRIRSANNANTRPRRGVACFPNRNCISILSFVTSSRLRAGKHEDTPMLYILATCQSNNVKILIHWLHIYD